MSHTKRPVHISSIANPHMERAKTIGHVKTYDGIYEAVIISAEDIQKNGRLVVRLVDTNVFTDFIDNTINEDEVHLNCTVRWSTPFGGATNLNDTVETPKAEKDRFGHETMPPKSRPDRLSGSGQESYGMWMIPPDVGNKVLVMFIGGDISKGVVIGCLFQHLMNHSLPGIARAKTFTEDGSHLETPVGEYNKASDDANNVDYTKNRSTDGTLAQDDVLRPINKPLYASLLNQGLENDTTRGLSDASARRETPSKVFGIKTPGGHQFVMDDGGEIRKIRLRTRNGNQILLDDTHNLIYFNNANGSVWMEFGSEGELQVFSKKSMSFRTTEDFNIRADRDINLDAGRNIKIKANTAGDSESTTQPQSTKGLAFAPGEIYLQSAGDTKIKVGSSLKIDTNIDTTILSKVNNTFTASAGNTNISSGGQHLETAPEIHMNGPEATKAITFDDIDTTDYTNIRPWREGEQFKNLLDYIISPVDSTLEQLTVRIADASNEILKQFAQEGIEGLLRSPRLTEEVKSHVTKYPTLEPYAGHDEKTFGTKEEITALAAEDFIEI